MSPKGRRAEGSRGGRGPSGQDARQPTRKTLSVRERLFNELFVKREPDVTDEFFGAHVKRAGNRKALRTHLRESVQDANTMLGLQHMARNAGEAVENWRRTMACLLARPRRDPKDGSRIRPPWEVLLKASWRAHTTDEVGAALVKSFMTKGPAGLNGLFAANVFEEGLDPVPFHGVPGVDEGAAREYLSRTLLPDIDVHETDPYEAQAREGQRYVAESTGNAAFGPAEAEAHRARWARCVDDAEQVVLALRLIRNVAAGLRANPLRDRPEARLDEVFQEIAAEDEARKAEELSPIPDGVKVCVERSLAHVQTAAQCDYLVLTSVLATPCWEWDHLVAEGVQPAGPCRWDERRVPTVAGMEDFRPLSREDVVAMGETRELPPGYETPAMRFSGRRAPDAATLVLLHGILDSYHARVESYAHMLETTPGACLNEATLDRPDVWTDMRLGGKGTWRPWKAPAKPVSGVYGYMRAMEHKQVHQLAQALRALCHEMEAEAAAHGKARPTRLARVDELLDALQKEYEGNGT